MIPKLKIWGHKSAIYQKTWPISIQKVNESAEMLNQASPITRVETCDNQLLKHDAYEI